MINVNRVLVPIDFSDFSEKALHYGMALCEKFDAELHLLHVLEVQPAAAPNFSMGLAMPKRVEESSDEILAALEKLPEGEFGCEVHRATAKGSPFVGIIDYAREKKIDLIALGTHGRTGLSHVFLGSIAENVARQAPCPVLIVRMDGHSFVSP